MSDRAQRHRDAQSRYRRSAKGRAAQADYRQRVGREAEYASTRERSVYLHEGPGGRWVARTPEEARQMRAYIVRAMGSLLAEQSRERELLSERIEDVQTPRPRRAALSGEVKPVSCEQSFGT